MIICPIKDAFKILAFVQSCCVSYSQAFLSWLCVPIRPSINVLTTSLKGYNHVNDFHVYK